MPEAAPYTHPYSETTFDRLGPCAICQAELLYIAASVTHNPDGTANLHDVLSSSYEYNRRGYHVLPKPALRSDDRVAIQAMAKHYFHQKDSTPLETKETQMAHYTLKGAIDSLYMQYRSKVDDIHAENRITPESTTLLRVYEDILDALKRLQYLESQQLRPEGRSLREGDSHPPTLDVSVD